MEIDADARHNNRINYGIIIVLRMNTIPIVYAHETELFKLLLAYKTILQIFFREEFSIA